MPKGSKLPPFDKYAYYRRAVQDPVETVRFLERVYREAFRVRPWRLREDFSGTFALSCEWVRGDPRRRALAVDRDPRPLRYGECHHLTELPEDARGRVERRRADVTRAKLPSADLICALNFSYFAFHNRKRLRDYFASCFRALPRRGLLVLDVLSGTEFRRALEDEVDYGDFVYSWEQASFDPITRRALFHIHFTRRGERRRSRVFTYDWRLWTVPELRELLEEVGFRRSAVYWEGTDEAWVAYIAAAAY